MQQHHRGGPRRRRTRTSADALAQGLGWFSLALGAAELAAPAFLARTLARPDDAPLFRAHGLREMATGIGILAARENPAPWLWARLAGDLLDLATLARGLRRDNPHRMCAGAAMAAVGGIAMLDLACARRLGEAARGSYIAPDYRDRSGFPRPAADMRGIARPGAAQPPALRQAGPDAGRSPAPLGTATGAAG